MEKETQDNYCIKRHMFFAATLPIIEENLSKEEAERLCREMNRDEIANGDGTYVHYEIHIHS